MITDLQGPFLTVIVAARNAATTIPATLTSLLRNIQDLPVGTVELVFVDGGCTDETMRLVAARSQSLAAFAQCHYLSAAVGVANAYNTGVAAANGRYGMFLNADDEWPDGYLAAVAATLERAEQQYPGSHCVAYTAIVFINQRGEQLFRREPPFYVAAVQKRQSVILHPNAAYPMVLLKRHPFPVHPDLRPSDQEQVYNLMKEAKPIRNFDSHYRYRIWANSGTVQRAAISTDAHPNLFERLLRLLCRVYVQSFESRLFPRLLMRLAGKTYWREPRVAR
jgi:glycosyltransferase involved in cell wall biosynthesis